MKSHTKLLIALAAGAVLGTLSHNTSQPFIQFLVTHIFPTIGQLFLRLIFMIVVPMIFCALVAGVYELGQSHGLKNTVFKTLVFTIFTSICSVLIGVTLVNILQPGAGLNLAAIGIDLEAAQKLKASASQTQSLTQILLNLIPKNPIDSAARAFDGEIVAFMIFSLFFGWALAKTKSSAVVDVLQGAYEACMHIVALAMRLAPLAVFCLVFVTASRFGLDVFRSLLFYVAIVVGGLLIQQFLVYSAILKGFTSFNPVHFFKSIQDVMLTAFATASSNATLPKALDSAKTDLKLDPSRSRFVLTVGSTANQNGTALFEGVTVLFLAQSYNIDLTLIQQFQVVLMSVIAGIGTAGVPGGSLPLIVILLGQVGIPPEGIGIVLGVDRFLDMCRSAVNVTGDLVIASVVSEKKKRVRRFLGIRFDS